LVAAVFAAPAALLPVLLSPPADLLPLPDLVVDDPAVFARFIVFEFAAVFAAGLDVVDFAAGLAAGAVFPFGAAAAAFFTVDVPLLAVAASFLAVAFGWVPVVAFFAAAGLVVAVADFFAAAVPAAFEVFDVTAIMLSRNCDKEPMRLLDVLAGAPRICTPNYTRYSPPKGSAIGGERSYSHCEGTVCGIRDLGFPFVLLVVQTTQHLHILPGRTLPLLIAQ
jgi:hypothetical protein